MLRNDYKSRYGKDELHKLLYNLKTEEDFDLEFDFKGEFLGRGAFGEVKKCLSKVENQKFYAIKRV